MNKETVDGLIERIEKQILRQMSGTFYDTLRKIALAALEDHKAGRVMVPREPIREQWAAMGDEHFKPPLLGMINLIHDMVNEPIYKAAIAAAPTSHLAKILAGDG